jgi:hypothetical protein
MTEILLKVVLNTITVTLTLNSLPSNERTDMDYKGSYEGENYLSIFTTYIPWSQE